MDKDSQNYGNDLEIWKKQIKTTILQEFKGDPDLADETLNFFFFTRYHRKYNRMKTIELRVQKKSLGDRMVDKLNGRTNVIPNRYIHVTCKPKVMFFLKKRKF